MNTAALCIKFIIFAVNFLIWCLGFTILGIGIWIRSDTDFWEYHNGLPIANYYQATYIAMAVGVILLVVGFLGCFGASIDSPCLLFTSIVLLFAMLILEIAITALVWKVADGDKLQIFLTDEIQKQIGNMRDDTASARFINLLQLHLECCGAYDMTDYGGEQLPQSCNSDRTNNIFIHGCAENLRRYLEIKGGILGGISLGLGLLEMISILLMTCLFCLLRQEKVH